MKPHTCTQCLRYVLCVERNAERDGAQKLTIVQSVMIDGETIGKTREMRVCLTPGSLERTIAEWTQPVQYHDGPRPFRPYAHPSGITGFRGPNDSFVFSSVVDAI